jgi:hypothetical protein
MPVERTFINFAYGSNMSSRRLRALTPSARAIGIGQLPAHRLMWHKAGGDGSAKCDAFETGPSQDAVWGVLYEIDAAQRPRLDAAEGLGRGYEHRTVQVLSAAGTVAAGAYQATHIDAALRPFDGYLADVWHGARELGLPARYQREIGAIEALAVVDADAMRRHMNLALLRGD